MQALTIFIALAFTVLALTRKNPGAAIGVLIFSMFIWPEYLRVFIGFMSVSVPRMVAFLLVVKIVATGKNKLKLTRVDYIVILGWLWIIISSILIGADKSHVSQMIGRGLDTVLLYFVTRMYITDERHFSALYFWVALTAVCMFVVSSIESTTSYSVYQKFIQYREWHWFDKDNEYRLGLMRAKASTSVHIYFGMAMMVITGLIWSLRTSIKNKAIYRIVLLSSFLAALTSLSSGPWIACILLIIINYLNNHTKVIKPLLYTLLLMSIFLELASNRHFYNLIDYIALDSHTAWYRTKLLEVAFSNLDEFWLFGVGSNSPNHWGMQLDGRLHIDIVNHFLLLGLYGGVAAMFLYIYSHYVAIKECIYSWKFHANADQRKILFSLIAILISLDISSMSVSLFGPVLLLSYILLGAMQSLVLSINNRSINEKYTQQ